MRCRGNRAKHARQFRSLSQEPGLPDSRAIPSWSFPLRVLRKRQRTTSGGSLPKTPLLSRGNAMTTRVAIYARVSTPDGKGQSPEMQLRELHEHCERRGWTIAGVYVDRMTGAKDRRPALDRLMADAHRRRFDLVAVWKFDRFARSVTHLLRALDTFRVLGIEFVSLSESLDTATPAGRMVLTVLGAVAELERSLIAERVRAGLRNARAKGKRLGRPRLAVDAVQIGRLRAQGRSIRDIAAELGCSAGLVHKTLANSLH